MRKNITTSELLHDLKVQAIQPAPGQPMVECADIDSKDPNYTFSAGWFILAHACAYLNECNTYNWTIEDLRKVHGVVSAAVCELESNELPALDKLAKIVKKEGPKSMPEQKPEPKCEVCGKVMPESELIIIAEADDITVADIRDNPNITQLLCDECA